MFFIFHFQCKPTLNAEHEIALMADVHIFCRAVIQRQASTSSLAASNETVSQCSHLKITVSK